MKKALVTGSAGLVGSACVRLLTSLDWQVVGIDNDTRQTFFGTDGSTSGNNAALKKLGHSRYFHCNYDIRDRKMMRVVMDAERPDFIIHTAGQPAHDLAARIPYDDFDVNAVGTLNLLVAARDFCPESPFVFTSTSKVYGDRPNRLPIEELETRYDYQGFNFPGVTETMPIDQCLHSVFGASKVAADVMCQEFGRYFNMPVGIFRGGCLTGKDHSAVELHGYLAYIVHCAKVGKPYTIFGYKGKQVRDQIHADDCATLFMEFFKSPKAGEVWNFGGGRDNSISILETITMLWDFGYGLNYEIRDKARIGDHQVYISDMTKLHRDFPKWRLTRDVKSIVKEMLDA